MDTSLQHSSGEGQARRIFCLFFVVLSYIYASFPGPVCPHKCLPSIGRPGVGLPILST